LHAERHNIETIGWLRAVVLGANDGIVSTASLVVGVAAAAADKQAVLLAVTAGVGKLLGTAVGKRRKIRARGGCSPFIGRNRPLIGHSGRCTERPCHSPILN
jgi:hypothetical protein